MLKALDSWEVRADAALARQGHTTVAPIGRYARPVADGEIISGSSLRPGNSVFPPPSQRGRARVGATQEHGAMKTRRRLLRGAGAGVAVTAFHVWGGSRVAVAQSEADSGTIRGQVTHGVSGAAQDAIEVQLWYLDATTRSRRLERTVLTDSAGRFEFAGLGIAPTDLYQPAVTFGGVEYVGPVLLAAGNANAAAAGQIAVGAADIEVFDVTHDPARVRLIRSNLILAQVNVANGEVSLIQTIIVSNAGPQTFVAQPVTASPVRIAPPIGAVGVAPLTGVRREDMVVTGDGGLVPATPFPPGETPLTMGYTLPYAGPRLAVTLPILQSHRSAPRARTGAGSAGGK